MRAFDAFVLCFVLIASCREKSAGKETPSGPVPELPDKGVEVVLDLATSKVGVGVAAESGSLLFGAPVVIPGVHWAWQSSLPEQVEISEGRDPWRRHALKQGGLLPSPPFRMRYPVDLGAASRNGFPVVGGRLFADQGALMATAFLFVLPQNQDLPLRVRFQSAGQPVESSSRASACGAACFELPGFWEAMETPFSLFVGPSAALGGANDFPWSVSLAAGLPRADVLAGVGEARTRLRAAWSRLSDLWGAPGVGAGYHVHLMVDGGCGFQGLEHDAATLLSVGWCKGDDFVSRLSRLVVHEAIHVWNGKLVHPEATASWPLLAFDAERLPLLYYYEGFTEGYSRILIAELMPEMREAVRAKWNASFSSLRGQALGKSLEDLSRSSPMLAYDAGAVLALRMAATLRQEHGVEEGRRLFWQIHRDVQDRGGFRIDKSLASQRCLRGSVFEPCEDAPSGYSASDLLRAFEAALGARWEELRAAHFEGAFLAEPAGLGSLLHVVGDAAGAAVDDEAFSLGAPTAEEGWPL